VVLVKNGYCPSCLGCQKNCYDFNPRAAIHSDLADSDPWYSGHKEFFIAALPGFIVAFFLAQNPAETGIAAYYLHLGLGMAMSLGIYMTVTRLVRISTYKASLTFSMAALTIFYWFVAPIVLSTISKLTGFDFPAWSSHACLAAVAIFALAVVFNGLRAELEFKQATAPAATEPRVTSMPARCAAPALRKRKISWSTAVRGATFLPIRTNRCCKASNPPASASTSAAAWACAAPTPS
jgi:hypothetical protein